MRAPWTGRERLVRAAHEVLGGVLGSPRPYALVDFPNHSNVGDSAIWLGERHALAALGWRAPAYVCDLEDYDPERLRRALPSGPILIHGGGNLGDLWPRHQAFRERVLADHPDRRVVQLPQSVEFRSDEARARAVRAFDDHPDFRLLVRDRRSLERARATFRVNTALCPDLAVCVPPRERSTKPDAPEMWLLRDDPEADPARPGPARSDAVVVDWLEEPGGTADARGRAGVIARLSPRPTPREAARADPDGAARARVERGIGLLSRGEVVVTDRLHAHILCLLTGIPHVVLPDRFGKIESFVETWDSASGASVFARDRDVSAAVERVRGAA